MSVRQRDPRVECPAFLDFVRARPCCACNRPPRSQAAHIRMGNLEIGKRPTGIAEKPSDRWAVPLCDRCHLNDDQAQHKVGEPAFWKAAGIDPFALAIELYAEFELTHPQPIEHKARRPRAKKARPHPSVSRPKPRGPKQKWPSKPFPAGRKFPHGAS